jgi:hypothetical protein
MSLFKNKNKMTFSWKELVCHGLLVKVGDPSLVKDILNMVMKERWLFLETEAREFHSGNVATAAPAAPHPFDFQHLHAQICHIRLQNKTKRNKTKQNQDELRHQINTAHPLLKLPSQLLQKCLENDVTISRRKLMDELLSSWKERIPEQRRRAVMANKETGLFRWRGDGVGEDYHSIEDSIKWYGGIHEGRYYLFWDKKIANAVADCAKRRNQQRSFLMSGFDINIIDGERKSWVQRPSDTWIYAYEQWTKNPGGWGARQSEFTMVHSIGKKEKRHIDDMFLKG